MGAGGRWTGVADEDVPTSAQLACAVLPPFRRKGLDALLVACAAWPRACVTAATPATTQFGDMLAGRGACAHLMRARCDCDAAAHCDGSEKAGCLYCRLDARRPPTPWRWRRC